MKSCIYEGWVRHRRFLPVENTFRYRLFFMYLDLAELDRVFRDHTAWSVNRFNLACFLRTDHTGDPSVPLDRAVRGLVEEETGKRPQGPIRLLTHLRYFGHCFNPVSFYFCYDASDQGVEAIVAEVHNTPWKEEHCYVFHNAFNEHPLSDWRRHHLSKVFHVSPFMDMNIRYDWRFRTPGEALAVHIINYREERRLFDASLNLRRREIDGTALRRVLTAYPPMTMKVVAMIHFQALRLWAKGAPFYPHPAKRGALSSGRP